MIFLRFVKMNQTDLGIAGLEPDRLKLKATTQTSNYFFFSLHAEKYILLTCLVFKVECSNRHNLGSPIEKRAQSWHRVVELTSNKQVQHSSTCQSGTKHRVLSIWGRGSGLVSQVPCLGDALVVVGVLKKVKGTISEVQCCLSKWA